MDTHTIESDFEHFLAYTGFCKESKEVQDKLFKAYSDGNARGEDNE